MPIKLREILLNKASNQVGPDNLKRSYGYKEEEIVATPDKISNSLEKERQRKEELDRVKSGELISQGPSVGPLNKEGLILKSKEVKKEAPSLRKIDEELIKRNAEQKLRSVYPGIRQDMLKDALPAFVENEKKNFDNFLSQETVKVKKELDPYALAKQSGAFNQLSEVEAQRKGVNENLGMFRVGPKETNVGAYSIPDKKFDYSQIYDVVNGKPQFNEKFLNEVARQRVLTNYQVPASEIAKNLVEGKINNYKYGFTEAQEQYNNFIDEANKNGILGKSTIFVDQVGKKAIDAFHTIARYAEGLAGEAGISIDGMPRSIMDAAEYSRKDRQKEKQIYNPEVQKGLAAQLGGAIGTQIPMILGTIATGGGSALVEGELEAATASLGGIKSAVVGTAMRSGLAESGIGKFGLDATANVLRGLNAGLKGAQKVGLGGVADNFITTFPTFFPTVHSSYYEDLYNKGYRGEELEQKAWQRALISMATESIYNPFHNIGSIGKGNVVESVLNASKKAGQTLC
jgi:hypothetical protein